MMSDGNRQVLKYIGDRISAARKESNISRDMAASALGIAERTLAAYERGEREISLDRLIELAKMYQITYTDLTDYKNVLNNVGYHGVMAYDRH